MASPSNQYLKYTLILWLPILFFIMIVSALGALKIVPFAIISIAAICTSINYGLLIFLSVVVFVPMDQSYPLPPPPDDVDLAMQAETEAGTAAARTQNEGAPPEWTPTPRENRNAAHAPRTEMGIEAGAGLLTITDLTPAPDDADDKRRAASDRDGLAFAAWFSLHLLLSTGFYALVLWAWFIRGEGSAWRVVQAAAGFEGYFAGSGSGTGVLGALVECLGRVGGGDGDGNVTVEEVGGCLRELGVR